MPAMKAKRFLKPDRHSAPNLESEPMNDENQVSDPNNTNPSSDNQENFQGNPDSVLQVNVGNAMPRTQAASMPMLQSSGDTGELGQARSMVAEGMRFVGNAELRGPCSIGGHVEGNLTQAPNAVVSVVVTETGRVKGDITAQKISVMGHTDGILDSGQGEVSLHDSASVHGLVRYGRIQVNGADLNATLERVAPAQSNA